MRKFLPVLCACLWVSITACASVSGNRPAADPILEITGRTDIQTIQVTAGQIVPPYGVRVRAQTAALELRISTSQKGTAEKLKDLQNAVDQITRLAAENKAIKLAGVSEAQVDGSYGRSETSSASIQNLDASAVTLKLAVSLAEDKADLMGSVTAFNTFLDGLNLPNTIAIQVLSVKAELGDLESYRQQIIARVYADLDTAQAKYGKAVKFEVSGLYDSLKLSALSDTAYYIYLEPVVKVSEF